MKIKPPKSPIGIADPQYEKSDSLDAHRFKYTKLRVPNVLRPRNHGPFPYKSTSPGIAIIENIKRS